MFQSGSFRLQPRGSDRVNSSFEMSDRQLWLTLLPGERVKAEVVSVKKCNSDGQLRKSISGKLLCTNFRVAFIPVETGISELPGDGNVLLGNNAVALSCIDRVVAVTSSRTKVLTRVSSLRFQPEQLLIYCKDFRCLHFQFEQYCRSDEIIRLITQSCQPTSLQELFLFDYALEIFHNLDSRRMNTEPEQEVNLTRMFESHLDWENELSRTGAMGWRVSLVNERFEVSASLSKILVVPRKIRDLDIKKACAHFSEGRIPRWHWHHAGSDLMRMSNFQSNTYTERDGVSKLEDLLYGTHSKLVIADLADELPTPAEIQLASSRLRNLCICENATSLRDLDEKWLSTLEGTHWLEYVRLCLKKATEVSALLNNQCLTVILQETDDRDLNCLISSLVQVILDSSCRTLLGFQSLLQKEWVQSGHRFSDRFNQLRTTDKDESPVFLLFLDCVWQLLDHYPVFFEFTEMYLMAIHDSTRVLLFGTYLFNCQRERARTQQALCTDLKTKFYPFTNGCSLTRSTLKDEQVVLKGGYFTREERSCPLPSVWDWSLQFPAEHQLLFKSALYCGDTQPLAQNGTSKHTTADKADLSPSRSVYLLVKGALLVPAQLLPWKYVSVTKKLTKWSQSLESLLEMEQPLRIQPCPSLDPTGLPLPSIPAPSIRLWKGCYLRWLAEVKCEGTYSLMSALTAQINSLQQRLHQVTDQQNAAPNRLDHQGNRISHCTTPHSIIFPTPTCRTDNATMETSFSTLASRTM